MAGQDISDRLRRRIESDGPISVEQFMGEANAAYYAARDPLGAAGDFITAPEISQMFGELIGLCLADLWTRAGSPSVRYVELGPGRGTLADDALRAAKRTGFRPSVHFVETSPALRARQAEHLPHAHWHDDLSTLPTKAPLLVVANEFFDALPVRQYVRTISGWRERMVKLGYDGFTPAPGEEAADHLVPEHLREGDPGGILESSPASVALMRDLSRRIARQGGAALIIDYGYTGHPAGDTLQAVHAHAYADPFARPGRSDLTAHVDFDALLDAATAEGLEVFGPVDQGEWLEALGIRAREAALAEAAPNRARDIAADRHRLTDADEMGTLFKAIAVVAPGWPTPEGF